MKKLFSVILILFSIFGLSCNDKTTNGSSKNLNKKSELSARDIDTIARFAVKKYGAAFIYYDICGFEPTYTSKPSDYNPTTSEIEKAVDISKDILNKHSSASDIVWEDYEMREGLFNSFYAQMLFSVKDTYEMSKENSK